MEAAVTAGAGFLLAVLWFDLMHDVLVRRHDRSAPLPEDALASIARYYRRVTTDAVPMNRLVALVMGATLASAVAEVVGTAVPDGIAVATLVLLAAPIGLAGTVTLPSARRLGRRTDDAARQSALARAVYRQHLACLVGVVAALVLQLGWV